MMTLPTKPTKKPAMTPKRLPKNGTIANAGRTVTLWVPGMRKLNRPSTA